MKIPEGVKKNVRSVLISNPKGVRPADFTRDYRNLLGQMVPWTKCGFRDLYSFMEAMPDVVRAEYSQGSVRYFAVTDGALFLPSALKKGVRLENGRGKPTLSLTERELLEEECKPNLKGLYGICFNKLPGISREIVSEEFQQAGEVAEISFTANYIFVRYASKEEALKAFDLFSHKYNMWVPVERGNPKQLVKKKDMFKKPRTYDKGVKSNPNISAEDVLDVYVGAIPSGVHQSAIVDKLHGIKVYRVRDLEKADTRYMFLTVERDVASEVVDRLHHSLVGDSYIIAQLAFRSGKPTERAAAKEDEFFKMVRGHQGVLKNLNYEENSSEEDEEYEMPPLEPSLPPLEDAIPPLEPSNPATDLPPLEPAIPPLEPVDKRDHATLQKQRHSKDTPALEPGPPPLENVHSAPRGGRSGFTHSNHRPYGGPQNSVPPGAYPHDGLLGPAPVSSPPRFPRGPRSSPPRFPHHHQSPVGPPPRYRPPYEQSSPQFLDSFSPLDRQRLPSPFIHQGIYQPQNSLHHSAFRTVTPHYADTGNQRFSSHSTQPTHRYSSSPDKRKPTANHYQQKSHLSGKEAKQAVGRGALLREEGSYVNLDTKNRPGNFTGYNKHHDTSHLGGGDGGKEKGALQDEEEEKLSGFSAGTTIVHVANFPQGTIWQDLREFFMECKPFRVTVDEVVENSHTHAIMYLPSAKLAQKALEKNGVDFNGRRLFVYVSPHSKQELVNIPSSITVTINNDEEDDSRVVGQSYVGATSREEGVKQTSEGDERKVVMSNSRTEGVAASPEDRIKHTSEDDERKIVMSNSRTKDVEDRVEETMLSNLRFSRTTCFQGQIELTSADLYKRDVTIMITHVVDETYAWGQVLDVATQGDLEWLRTAIDEMQDPEHHLPYSPGGATCCAMYEGEYFRGCVLEREGDDVTVFSIDFGNVVRLTLDDLVDLPDEFWGVPGVAWPLKITSSPLEDARALESETVQAQILNHKTRDSILQIKVIDLVDGDESL